MSFDFRPRTARFGHLALGLFLAVLANPAAQAQAPAQLFNLVPQFTCSVVNESTNTATGCNTSNLNLYETLSNKVIPLPTGTQAQPLSNTTTLYSVNPTVAWVALPSGASVPLTGLPVLPTSNTTIKLRILAQTNPGTGYTSILGMSSTSPTATNESNFVIGQNGSDWAYGRTVDDYYFSTSGYWMTPWDVTDLYYQQTNVAETLYYTFLPDGRLRIDLMIPYLVGSNVQYVWNEVIQDGGWPTYNREGIPAQNNQTTLPFLPASNLYLGTTPAGTAPFAGSPVPASSAVKIVGITAYNGAFTNTTNMLNDFLTDIYGANVPTIPTGIAPCNTGTYLNSAGSSVITPCGSSAGNYGPVPAPPTTITPLTSGYAPTNLSLELGSQTSIKVTWSEPLVDISPQSYLVTWAGNGGGNYGRVAGGQSSFTINGYDTAFKPNTQLNVSVSVGRMTSGVPWTSSAAATASILTGPGAVTNLNLVPGVGNVSAAWAAPNPSNPPASYYVQLYRVVSGAPIWRQTATVTSPTVTFSTVQNGNPAYIIVTPSANASPIAPLAVTSNTVIE